MQRQAPNVGRMRLLGATVVPVVSGDRTLRAAIDEALRDWVSDPADTYYLLGSAVGPHPYPYLVRELQSVIGREARAQLLAATGRLPDALIACVGGGSNSIGMFHAFVPDTSVEIIGVKAGGRGAGLGDNAATVAFGRPGVLHGTYSMLLQNEDGQIQETHSVSAGLDYPGVGPEHALLAAAGRVHYQTASDAEALAGVKQLSECEGILPALESAHALAGAERWARAHPGRTLLVCLSGRGDKDMSTLRRHSRPGSRGSPRERIGRDPRRGAAGGAPALVAYLTAGFPQRAAFGAQLAALGRAADVLEMGAVHRSDGRRCHHPARQPRGARAGGEPAVDSRGARDAARGGGAAAAHELSQPAARLRRGALAAAAARAGVGDFVGPDLPLDESSELRAALRRGTSWRWCRWSPRWTADERLGQLCAASEGFVYAVTATGTTGRNLAVPRRCSLISIACARSQVPVCAGFGIRSREQVQRSPGTSTAWWWAPRWWKCWSAARIRPPGSRRCAAEGRRARRIAPAARNDLLSDAMKTLTIAARFCGPSSSANGGYFAGTVATLAAHTVSVRLKVPPPLDTEFTVRELPTAPAGRQRR